MTFLNHWPSHHCDIISPCAVLHASFTQPVWYGVKLHLLNNLLCLQDVFSSQCTLPMAQCTYNKWLGDGEVMLKHMYSQDCSPCQIAPAPEMRNKLCHSSAVPMLRRVRVSGPDTSERVVQLGGPSLAHALLLSQGPSMADPWLPFCFCQTIRLVLTRLHNLVQVFRKWFELSRRWIHTTNSYD